MDKKLIISVIVPVYNGEKFVRRAADSVVRQMDGRIELILVDDGSTDGSGAICDEYATKYPNIQVIHKANGGTSSAKNRGIDIAQGAYLSFMDCDDFFDADMFEQIIPLLIEHQPDCFDFGWRYWNNCGESVENLHQCPKNVLIPREELESLILPPLLNLRDDKAHFIYDFCVTKVFKAEIIQKHQVRFDEDKRTWEDRTFLLRHLKYCQNFYAIDKCFYNYVYTPNSLGQRYFPDILRIMLRNFEHYRQMYCDRFDFETQYAIDYRAKAVENLIFRSLEQKENQTTIRSNILETLSNEQVVEWFAKREPSQPFHRVIKDYLLAGEYEKALECFKKNKPKEQSISLLGRCKRIVKKVMGRIWGKK